MTDDKKSPSIDFAAPFYAAVGVGDFAITTVGSLLGKIRETAQDARNNALSHLKDSREKHVTADSDPFGSDRDISEFVKNLDQDQLRKAAEGYSKVALELFLTLAERGESATRKILHQSDTQEALQKIEESADDVIKLTDRALGKVAQGTRALGEEVTKSGTKSRTPRARSQAKKNRLDSE